MAVVWAGPNNVRQYSLIQLDPPLPDWDYKLWPGLADWIIGQELRTGLTEWLKIQSSLTEPARTFILCDGKMLTY